MGPARRLYRNSSSGRIAGVCSGIADYLEADVTFVRLIWVIVSIVPGTLIGGIVAYAAAWLIMPDQAAPMPAEPGARRLTRSTTDRRIAGVCGGLAEYLSVDSTVVRLLWAILTIVPGAIVLGIVAYILAWFIVPETPTGQAIVTPSVA
jgi:phage shock protein PspC (stress-responsive transcriptional regulator)